VTLYFSNGRYLVPVSRRMPRSVDLPRSTLQALLVGPAVRSGLSNPLQGVGVRSFALSDGVAQIDLSSTAPTDLSEARAAEAAIVETMTALPEVRSVSLSVNGKAVGDRGRVPLLYYVSSTGLIAVPASATTPRAALNAYLSRPPDPELVTLPSDVQVLTYEHDPADGLLRLDFSYTQSVRTLALEQPERMRLLLLGLIASLTEFPSVRAVQLDFEGRTRLGLGQCSDLLRTPQPRPALLNDERLLER
jgi:spore germination protein GerM